uniref:Talin n=1 Tax=Oscarella pearsei TaxID=1940113 RepID=TLN_OSCPE|nr:RecName: Full=Talin [Oscarella pearsei]AYN71349.1 talin [Oscarella pearsei]|eukprot:m.231848 g.231848  ORF g.231848 m.231848 type:complete len:2532 (+) comp40074_c1_seq28:100-7695(+)
MASLALRINIVDQNNVKTMQFEPSMIVYDACKMIRERIGEKPAAGQGYGLFLANEDPKRGVWLESGRTLDFYLLKPGDLLEYKNKMRPLRVRMMDESLKTVLVDDSFTVDQLVKTVCDRIGITNNEEFSLVCEDEEATPKKAAPPQIRNQKKMDELKKKLHTEDDVNWLSHDKTLRSQGISESQVLLLRKKFFFSDQNVDRNDPVQLNQLYAQARDAIVDGTHPCTYEEAINLAALQCQIVLGNHDSGKHKPGYITEELGSYLPREYVKAKGVERRVFTEHAKFTGLSQLNAKFRYIQVVRSLKTYGVTFFLVKEKMKGKNKLAPRLLGITRESIMRVDEKTKEVMKTWPLTTVRRWAASPNSFTLDFGDYSESYYSVQTTEGEQISRLIAGYIDIILKKKRATDRKVPEVEDETTLTEDLVLPARATQVSYVTSTSDRGEEGQVAHPGVLRAAGESGALFVPGDFLEGSHIQRQAAQTPGYSPAQQALQSSIAKGLGCADVAINELEAPTQLPPLGSDPQSLKWKQNTLDVSRQNVGSQLAAMTAAAAQMVGLTGADPADIDYTAVGAAVTTLSSNLTELSKGVRMIAALQGNSHDGEKLLEAARGLAGAVRHLLKSAEPSENQNRKDLLDAAAALGISGTQLMALMGDPDVTQEVQDALLSKAKAVAVATSGLVQNAKMVAGKCPDSTLQSSVITATKGTATATSQLVACTKIVASTITNPLCQEQLINSAKQVAGAVEGTVSSAQNACSDDDALRELGMSATKVTDALQDLLRYIRDIEAGGLRGGKYEEQIEMILAATERLINSLGNAQETVKSAKTVAMATSQMVSGVKDEASGLSDEDAKRRLLAAARGLADATAKMVDAAKVSARDPSNVEAQAALKAATEDLRAAVNAAANNALKKKLIKKLEVAAKHTAAAATQCIAAAQGAGPTNRNQSSQQQLLGNCKTVADHIGRLVQAVRASMANPESPSSQLGLINASQAMIQPCGKMIAASKAAVPTIGDQAAALQLANFAKQTATCLAELRTAAGKAAEACGSLEIESAIDVVRQLEADLLSVQRTAASGKFLPLPGETAESCALELGATSKTVGASMAQLLTAAAQGNENYTGIAARDTANALKVLSGSVRGVAAATDDRSAQEQIIVTAIQVMAHSRRLIEEAKKAIASPTNPENQSRLAQAAKAVSQALNQVINCLPGQRDVDAAIKDIAAASVALTTGQFPSAGGQSFQDVQTSLSVSSAALNVSASELVANSRGTHMQLAQSSQKFAGKYKTMLHSGLMLAGLSKEKAARSKIVGYLRSVSMSSSKLLLAAKALSADPNAPNVKNNLAAAARGVTDAINALVTVCTASAPGQKECDNALRKIQTVGGMLANPVEPVNDNSYFVCLDAVMENSKILGEAMGDITKHAKGERHDEFGSAVSTAASAVCTLTESAAQAAYLVAISDSSSTAAISGLVDTSQFARAQQAIREACEQLLNPSSAQQQVLSSATVIAKHTSGLCNACKIASGKTKNPVAKRKFVQSAKDVATSTANLVKSIKALAGTLNDGNRGDCAKTTKPLLEAIDDLVEFASAAEFASVPAQISPEARSAQAPILVAGNNMLIASSSLISSAKNLAVNPRDAATWQLLASHSKAVSDAIRRLVAAVKDKSPGQAECDQAIELLNMAINEVDQATLAAISSKLTPSSQSTLQGFHTQMMGGVSEISDLIEPVALAAKGDAEKLGHMVTNVVSYFVPLSKAAVGAASKTTNPDRQMAVLEQTKTLAESALQLMYAAKESGGNPAAAAAGAHANINEAAGNMTEAVKDLKGTLEMAASEAGLTAGMVDTIHKAAGTLDDPIHGEVSKSFGEYQESMVHSAKIIILKAQDMVGRAGTSPGELGVISKDATTSYCALATDCRGALATADDDVTGARLKAACQQLGDALGDLIQCAGSVQSNPTDAIGRKELSDCAKKVGSKVNFVLAALQAGAKGTQACINAVADVSGIVGDLDTSVMFATAGVLNPDREGDTFGEHREDILKTAKTLVEDTKTLVSGAAASQEQLAKAAVDAVGTITRLADHVKKGAAALTSEDQEAQVLLLNAVRDVASSLGALITATKNASGKSVQDPAMEHLRTCAKAMVSNVSSLLKTVKSVEDEAARGARALESAIDAINAQLEELLSPNEPGRDASPEDIIRVTKGVTLATAKAVAAGNSGRQDDVTASANLGRKAIIDMMLTTKAAALKAESEDSKIRSITAAKECTAAFRSLLELVHSILMKPSHDKKQKLTAYSKEVATCVSEVVQAAEVLKGTDWVDPSDPNIIAENELLNAAASIEAAAKKLALLKPREKKHEADETLSFDEQILEAARAIAAATGALIKSATTAQRELVAQGRLRPGVPGSDDSQWAEGLVSAARMVAAATQSLCEAANSAVQGVSSEEKLIASAKAVAASTAQLLLACQVKADADSENFKRLHKAGGAVKRAAENLVTAAKRSSEEGDDEEVSGGGQERFVGGIAREIEAQEAILRKERELDEAKRQLKKIRHDKYKRHGQDEP